jgi:hypothetical protein
MKQKHIAFATKDRLVQPTGGLIASEVDGQDHILGAVGGIAGPDFEMLVPDGQWTAYLPEGELQRNRFGDTFMCVSFSWNNIVEFLANRRYGEVLNMSDVFLGSGSGTIRGQGNSKRAVAEWARRNGFVHETDYPYTESMTLDQAYAPLVPPLLAKGKANLDKWAFYWKWVGNNSPAALKDALRFSPVQVDVTGFYDMNDKGIVVWNREKPQYAHEVTVFGYEEGVCWHVFDSEATQFIRFDWAYPFGSPLVVSAKKKMNIQILKEKGKPALAVKHFSENCMIGFSGGTVEAQALFKSLYGITDFRELPIKEVDKFPCPMSHLIVTRHV